MARRNTDDLSRTVAAAIDDIASKVRAGDTRWLEQDIKRWAETVAACNRIVV